MGFRMSNCKKFLIVALFLIFGVSTASADVMWPSLFVACGRMSLWVIIGGLIVETGFVKYFTKENWKKSILVSVSMNLATGFLGTFLIFLGGMGLEGLLEVVEYVLNIHVRTFHWTHWIAAYVFAIVINTLIEGGVIKLMLKLKFKDTYKWLFVANAISIIMCAIYVAAVVNTPIG